MPLWKEGNKRQKRMLETDNEHQQRESLRRETLITEGSKRLLPSAPVISTTTAIIYWQDEL